MMDASAISQIAKRAKLLCTALLCLAGSQSLYAQSLGGKLPPMAPLFDDTQPPGVVGAMQLQRNPQLRGYFQPVEFRGPEGMEISFATDGAFTEPMAQPVRVALLVGVPYRLKVTGVPFEPEAELFPTIELIDRTYPPAERAHRFPVPIELDQVDLDEAMSGNMVSRVVYLEDSQIADPVSYDKLPQRVTEAVVGEDLLMSADVFGRPLAIVRLGSRVPATADGWADPHFLFGCPPIAPIKDLPDPEKLYEEGVFQRYEGLTNSNLTPAFHTAKTGRIGDSIQ